MDDNLPCHHHGGSRNGVIFRGGVIILSPGAHVCAIADTASCGYLAAVASAHISHVYVALGVLIRERTTMRQASYDLDEFVENAEFDLELDAVNDSLISGLNIVEAGVLEGEECNIEHYNNNVDSDKVCHKRPPVAFLPAFEVLTSPDKPDSLDDIYTRKKDLLEEEECDFNPFVYRVRFDKRVGV